MARTYPAKRSRIATLVDVRFVWAVAVDGTPVIAEPDCLVCEQVLDVGDRIVGHYWRSSLMHARCADAGEALP